ncbi:MAG: hypothetical protein NZZ41_00865 [Candidatus Dojkabacteria bacterium]|nr:hypothetical protein [Candidatus Dojkabacteria bacterium]
MTQKKNIRYRKYVRKYFIIENKNNNTLFFPFTRKEHILDKDTIEIFSKDFQENFINNKFNAKELNPLFSKDTIEAVLIKTNDQKPNIVLELRNFVLSCYRHEKELIGKKYLNEKELFEKILEERNKPVDFYKNLFLFGKTDIFFLQKNYFTFLLFILVLYRVYKDSKNNQLKNYIENFDIYCFYKNIKNEEVTFSYRKQKSIKKYFEIIEDIEKEKNIYNLLEELKSLCDFLNPDDKFHYNENLTKKYYKLLLITLKTRKQTNIKYNFNKFFRKYNNLLLLKKLNRQEMLELSKTIDNENNVTIFKKKFFNFLIFGKPVNLKKEDVEILLKILDIEKNYCLIDISLCKLFIRLLIQ